MNDLVRVKSKATGAEYNWSRTLAESDPDLTIVDRPTFDAGNQVPPLFAAPKSPRHQGEDTATAATTTKAETKEATES